MPHIICHNLNDAEVLAFSRAILDDISAAAEIERDWFEFYAGNNRCVSERGYQDKQIYLEIKWFKREKQIQDQVAYIINDYLRRQGYGNIVIYFDELAKANYYENMNQF